MSLDGERNSDTARMMLGHANSLTVHTGNVIDWFLLKKNRSRLSAISPDELMDGLNCVMKTWVRNVTHDPLRIKEAASNLEIAEAQLVKEIDPSLRKELKISVKLFLSETKPELIRDAINKITSHLNVQRLDSVLVSFSLPSKDINQKVLPDDYILGSSVTDFESVKAVWLELESCIKSGSVGQIGVCDFDQESLQELHNWAEIKPSVDQINLNSCCQVPNDLVQYATENGIELLTHNDPPEILPAGTFQSFIAERTEDASANEWVPSFIARYAVLVRYRGIVHSKGYIVSADRHLPSAVQLEDFAFF